MNEREFNILRFLHQGRHSYYDSVTMMMVFGTDDERKRINDCDDGTEQGADRAFELTREICAGMMSGLIEGEYVKLIGSNRYAITHFGCKYVGSKLMHVSIVETREDLRKAIADVMQEAWNDPSLQGLDPIEGFEICANRIVDELLKRTNS